MRSQFGGWVGFTSARERASERAEEKQGSEERNLGRLWYPTGIRGTKAGIEEDPRRVWGGKGLGARVRFFV